MEERYMNVHRRRQARRPAPPRRYEDDGWYDAPPRKKPRRRGAAASVAVVLYKTLVVISAVIVALYIGFTIVVRPPAQTKLPEPTQNGTNNTPLPGNPAGSDVTTPKGDAVTLERRPGVYNIFLAATDMEGFRTDIMMVMCYDTKEQTVGVVSVPRDTLVARSSGNPHLVYGKGGLEQRVADVSNMLGIPIDYYIKVNIQGFITLVDYLNGIDFYVPCNMDYDDPVQNLHIHYKEGQRHLNGQQAMEVARFRKNNDGSGYTDTGRTQTQQQLLVALAKKVLSWGSLTKINGFVEIFNKNVDTDLSMNDMLYFASQAVNLDPSTGVETATLEGNGFGMYRGYMYCYELDQDKTLETVNRLVNPYNRDLTLKEMNLAKADSYHN